MGFESVKVVYPPEIHLLTNVLTVSSGSKGQIDNITNFKPYYLQLLGIAADTVAGGKIVVDVDGRKSIMELTTDAMPAVSQDDISLNLLAKSSMTLKLLASANITSLPVRYFIKAFKPGVFDKLLYGDKLITRAIAGMSEAEINQQYAVEKKLEAGMAFLRRQPIQVREYVQSFSLTANANDNPDVIRISSTSADEYVVLLGIRAEKATANDLFTKISRDGKSEITLNNFCYGGIAVEHSVFMPAMDYIYITLQNQSALSGYDIMIRYGVYKLTLVEKLKWGLTLSEEEASLVEEYDLASLVAGGLL